MKMRTDSITITPIQLLEAEKISQSVDLSQEEQEILANSKRDKDGVEFRSMPTSSHSPGQRLCQIIKSFFQPFFFEREYMAENTKRHMLLGTVKLV